MKKIMDWALLLAFVFLAANCGASRQQIHTQSKTLCEGIFCEVTTPDGPPPGYADVVIKASLKTHLPGEGALLEFGNCPHGGEFYHFVINIDGQAVTWKVPGQRENISLARGQHSQDEGDGMKYALEKKIWLRAGTHRVFLGVPESNATKTVTVNLQEGKSYTLEFRPIYTRPKAGHPSFRNGFLGFNAVFNNTSNN
jgi:hypothetical protein